jgi:hypothetical protein
MMIRGQCKDQGTVQGAAYLVLRVPVEQQVVGGDPQVQLLGWVPAPTTSKCTQQVPGLLQKSTSAVSLHHVHARTRRSTSLFE